jgi:hypothetical protein
LQRINSHRLDDVLEPGLTEIVDLEVEAGAHLPVGVLGKADRAGLRDPLQSRGNIDAVAHQIAVALLDHVAQVNSDPELYSALGGHAGVAFDHSVLNFHRAADGVDDATELDKSAVASALTTRP